MWRGKDFIESYHCAILLILPSIIYLTQGIANITIIALNKVKLQSYVFMGMATINIVLSIMFSKFWGVFGASLAICNNYVVYVL